MLHTRLNQPDRIAFDSIQDTNTFANGDGARFTNIYSTPVLQPRQIALLRATIPNVTLQVPDYSLVFWYYATTGSATTTPTAANLYAVRLYPRQWSIPTGTYSGTAVGGVNMRFCNTPADLVSLLNTAAATGGDNATLNPFWIAGDVKFSYSTATNQITFTGLTASTYYCNAGWNDPNVLAAIAGTASKGVIKMANQTSTLTNPTTTTNQPLLANATLNEVVGYSYSGNHLPPQALTTNVNVANITALSYATNVAVPVDSFPNLVASQCLYLYSSVVGSSGNTSTGQKNLLAVVPVNTSNLGVINYTPTAPVFTATKIVQEIYQIDIEVRDDNNQPFLLPDNANLQLELGLKYDAYD